MCEKTYCSHGFGARFFGAPRGHYFYAFGTTNSFAGSSYGAHMTAETATEFIAGITDQVTSIDLPLWTFQGVGSTAKVVLANDASGLPGTAIETFHITGLTVTPTVVSAASVLHPLLTVGTKYWLELFTGDVNTNVLWNLSDQQLPETGHAGSGSAFDASTIVWSANRPGVPPAFDVQGSVPEPATVWLIAAPLALGLLLVPRKAKVNADGRPSPGI